jgi:hypothetical protein
MDLFGPCLYLCHRPEAADLLARAIATRLRPPYPLLPSETE